MNGFLLFMVLVVMFVNTATLALVVKTNSNIVQTNRNILDMLAFRFDRVDGDIKRLTKTRSAADEMTNHLQGFE